MMNDNFGFVNQGSNYEKFRPKYSSSLYMKSIEKIKQRNKYLDIAMGTGQLLFAIAPYFGKSKGVDISNNMLEAAKEKLSQLSEDSRKKIMIEKMNVMDIPSEEKYDLITVGQAFHWFPVRQALQKIKGILEPEGKLDIISYIVRGVEGEAENQIYDRFYSKVKKHFEFDRTELENLYKDKSKYPFEEVYPNVEFTYEESRCLVPKDTYVKYLKTYSGYNQFLSKCPQEEDPIKEVEEKCENQVTIIIDYFSIECSLQK